jgi:nucleoside-diphosphate-sugar epimerase
MPTYLVTGGAGFIGSNIVEELLRRNESVRVLDNFLTGSKNNLEFVEQYASQHAQYELIEGDIRSREDLRKALKGIDYVLHQAALRSVLKSFDDPCLTNDINVNGTLNLLFEAKKAGVKRVVYASSSSCYGDVASFPQREDFKSRPISPYGVSKLAAENYCYAFSKTFSLETVSLRYFNVFGPRQNPENKYSTVIPAILSRMLDNKAPIVEWDGEQSRDFTYVGNVVDANIACSKAEGISGEVINVACGNSISVLELVDILNKLLKTSLRPEFRLKRAGDIRKTWADVSKIRSIIGPCIDFHQGLELTVEWFKQNQDRLLKI